MSNEWIWISDSHLRFFYVFEFNFFDYGDGMWRHVMLKAL